MTLTPPWEKARVLLLCSTEAIRLCQDGGYEPLPVHVAVDWVLRRSRREMTELRRFSTRAGLCTIRTSNIDDTALLTLLRAKIRARELSVIRAGDLRAGGKNERTAELKRLVREIERQSRQGLRYGGRRYRLVADVQLDRIPDRDSYEVVRRDDGSAILSALAKQNGTSNHLAKLLSDAAEALTKDWRPPFTPDGLVLLRRLQAMVSSVPDDGPALTPSQLKKLAKSDWIEIEVVDQDGEPLSGARYTLQLADKSVREGALDADGFVGVYEIESGTCNVVVGEVKQAAAAADEPEEAAEAAAVEEETSRAEDAAPPESGDLFEEEDFEEELEVEPITLRFKLLNLIGKPITGAEVTVAGTTVTSDSEGMIEVEVVQGSGEVTATLPTGEVILNPGGFDPQEDSSDDGFKARLFNMGFLWDASAGPGDDEMVIALQDFQAEYKLMLSGQLDDATKAKLVEVYGC